MAAKRRVPAISLRELRGLTEKTQADVARESGLPQGEVSVLENRETLENVRLRTLQRYVEALGGRLEVAAVFDDARQVIVT